MFEKNDDKQQIQLLLEKSIAKATYSRARAFFKAMNAGETEVTDLHFLKEAAEYSYEYSMEEAMYQWPAIGDEIRAHKIAIDKKQKIDRRQYRNSATAYLTLVRLVTGSKPGLKEEKTAKKIDDWFRGSFEKASVQMAEIDIWDKDIADLLYEQMMATLQEAAKARVVAIFDDPTGFLGTILAITSYLIRISVEDSGQIIKNMCRQYYEELGRLRCNVDLIAQKASADLQQFIGTSLENPDKVNALMEKLFVESLKQSKKGNFQGAALIHRHRQLCLWALDKMIMKKGEEAP